MGEAITRSLLAILAGDARPQLDSLLAGASQPCGSSLTTWKCCRLSSAVVCRHIRQLVQRYPQHQVIVGSNPAAFNSALFSGLDLHILVLRNLGRRRIRHFLQRLPPGDPAGPVATGA